MAFAQDTGGSGSSGGDGPYLVMVVDDSAVVRGLETRMLEADPEIKVVASVGNGQAALQALDRIDVEVVVLDIEMPVMDGLTALPKIIEKKPGIRVLMSSTLTHKNAEISMKAMELGATDYIPKPSSSKELTGAGDFQELLVSKVKVLGASARRGTGLRRTFGAGPAPSAAAPSAPAAPAVAKPAAAAPAAAPRVSLLSPTAPIQLRQASTERPDVIAIGSSTGGPQALFTVLTALKAAGGVEQPILITQHMPPTFTAILAEHITRIAGLAAKEATQGEKINGGMIYIAPGDWHMLIDSKGGERYVQLEQGEPENFCRPAVDPMFRSIVKAYGKKVLACVLTGMGADGAKGGKVVAEAGGTVIAQDEASSVVWGMPGATAQTGVCSAVLPIDEIGSYIQKFATRRA